MKRTTVLTAGLTLGVVVALQAGCAGTGTVTKTMAAPEADPQGAAAEPAKLETAVLSGKVVETMQAGGYTYVNLEKDGKQSWAAMSANVKVGVGEELALRPGMVLHNFNSKALNRTFDKIVFTDGAATQAPTASRHGSAPKVTAATPVQLSGTVLEVLESGGYTYISLEKDAKTTWVALPVTKVNVGQQVEVLPGAQMGSFTSKTLNRTFEGIIFAPGLVQDENGASAAPAPGTAGSLPPNHPKLDPTQQAVPDNAAPAAKERPKMGSSMMMAQSGKEQVTLAGKVVESIDSGGYTFICLEQDGNKIWAAVPTRQVSVGQELKLQPGTEMINFKSKSLNRNFASIIFSGGVLD